jgi:hypothetical protein
MIKGMAAFPVLCVMFVASCSARRSSEQRFAVGSAPGIVLVEDLNGDGRLDLVVANEKGSDVSVLLSDGKGGFSPARGSPFPAGPSPNDLTSGDFNGDGRVDLAIANHETQHLTVLLGDGRGALAPARGSPVTVVVRPHVHGVAAGDFNGDGSLDLVTDSWANDRVVVVFGDGKGRFAMPGTYVSVGKHPYQRVRVADLNGDSRADIIMMSRSGAVASRAVVSVPGHPKGLVLRDLNGDGKAEIVTTNSTSDSVTVVSGN